VLAAALAVDADYIVTGDADLLALRSYQDIQILTVRGFLDLP
jgi:predicted nucleic acid-binding protein